MGAGCCKSSGKGEKREPLLGEAHRESDDEHGNNSVSSSSSSSTSNGTTTAFVSRSHNNTTTTVGGVPTLVRDTELSSPSKRRTGNVTHGTANDGKNDQPPLPSSYSSSGVNSSSSTYKGKGKENVPFSSVETLSTASTGTQGPSAITNNLTSTPLSSSSLVVVVPPSTSTIITTSMVDSVGGGVSKQQQISQAQSTNTTALLVQSLNGFRPGVSVNRTNTRALQEIVEHAEEDLFDIGRSIDDIEREDPSDPAAVEFVRTLRNVTVNPALLERI